MRIMPLCKILVDYQPSEGWVPGDIVDISDPKRLLIEGKVVLVDEQGHEIERPNIITCPICPPSKYSAPSATALAVHILDTHSRTGAVPPTRREQLIKDKDGGKGLVTEEKIIEGIKDVKKMEAIEDVEKQQEEVRRQRVEELAGDRAADYIESMEKKIAAAAKTAEPEEKVEVAEPKKEKKPQKDADKMTWAELRKAGLAKGVYRVGMSKIEVVAAVKKAK